MLKQGQYAPMKVEYQVIILYAATKKYLLKIDTKQVMDFQEKLFDYVARRHPELPEMIRTVRALTDEVETLMKSVIEEYMDIYVNGKEE